MANTSNKSKAAQDFVPIKEVRDGIVVLKDDSLRAVLMGSSLNFALKSADEQKSILLQFQNFINSIDFTVQFFTQSRDLDIRPYIATLEQRYREQTNDLLKIQTAEYIEFIKTFTDNANIMEKTFFVVVPFGRAGLGGTEGIKSMLGLSSEAESEEMDLAGFEEARSQLEQRISVVEQGLVRSGIRVVQLGSEELIELYYQTFNPGDLEKPMPLKDDQQ